MRRTKVFKCLARQARKRKGLSLEQAANLLDLSVTSIKNIEAGHNTLLSTADSMAKLYGLTVSEVWVRL